MLGDIDLVWMIQRQHRSTGRNSHTIASFLLKTYEILEHPDNKSIICWDKDDIGFVVVDPLSFTKEILPKYFRHANFSSFVRQLNMYDFHKVKQDNDMLVFKNSLFIRGQQHKLRLIKRKAAKKIVGQHKRYYAHDKSEHEKNSTTLKWLKKSTESEINHSCLFFEKSIEAMVDKNQAMERTKDVESKIGEGEAWHLAQRIYELREECNDQLGKTIRWLDEHLDQMKRKLKVVSTCSLQLAQNNRQSLQEEENKVSHASKPQERSQYGQKQEVELQKCD